jgi:hypothetical protein
VDEKHCKKYVLGRRRWRRRILFQKLNAIAFSYIFKQNEDANLQQSSHQSIKKRKENPVLLLDIALPCNDMLVSSIRPVGVSQSSKTLFAFSHNYVEKLPRRRSTIINQEQISRWWVVFLQCNNNTVGRNMWCVGGRQL